MRDLAGPLRYVVALILIGGGVGGTVGALLGMETLSPAYFAVAIAVGAAVYPAPGGPVCRVRNRLSV